MSTAEKIKQWKMIHTKRKWIPSAVYSRKRAGLVRKWLFL